MTFTQRYSQVNLIIISDQQAPWHSYRRYRPFLRYSGNRWRTTKTLPSFSRVVMVSNSILQGVFVSVLYCFLNSEVQEAVRHRLRQYRTRWRGLPPARPRETRSSGTRSSADFTFTSNVKTLSSVQAFVHSPDPHCLSQHVASSSPLHSVHIPRPSDLGTTHHTPCLRQLSTSVPHAEAIPLEYVGTPPDPHPPLSAPRGYRQHMTTIA